MMQHESASRPRRHLAYIDALRGIAVAAVIATHVAGAVHIDGMAGQIFVFAAKGVQLFYLVSALTLMLSMHKRMGSERHPSLNFFLRRFFRIAPAFYAVLILYCLLGWLAPRWTGILPTTFPHALLILSFLNGWRPDVINLPVVGQWSIAVEVTFYVLLPLIFPLLTTFRRAIKAWFLTIFLYFCSSWLAMHLAAAEGFSEPDAMKDFAYWWFPSQLPVFMCGIGAYFIVIQKLPFFRSMLPYLGGALLVLLAHHFYADVGELPLVAIAIMAGVILLSRFPVSLFVNRMTRFLGKISFSAYLCHPLVIMTMTGLGGGKVLGQIGSTALRMLLAYSVILTFVLPLSYLTWRYVETPGQHLGGLLISCLSRYRGSDDRKI